MAHPDGGAAHMLGGLVDAWQAFLSRAGAVGWPLLVCALLAVFIIVERMVFLVFAKAEARAGETAAETGRRLVTGLDLLRLIAAVAPLLGLLGTVLGIQHSFAAVAASGRAATPAIIAGGIGEALTTTIAGMVIALTALVGAHLIRKLAAHRLRSLDSPTEGQQR